jgi:hypothetical protein
MTTDNTMHFAPPLYRPDETDTSQPVSPAVSERVTTWSPLAIVPGVVAFITALLFVLH